MKFREMDTQQIETALETSVLLGLEEADVKKRQQLKGYNELQEGEKQSAILLFFAQFKDFMVIVLLAATLISGILGEYIDAIAIIAIILVNGIFRIFSGEQSREIS